MTTSSFPPGPKTAASANLYALRRDPLGFFDRLSREFGDFVRFNTGAHDFFLINHPDLIKDLLVTNDRCFAKWFAIDRTKELLGQGLFVSEGAYHQRQRKLSQPAFHRERIADYAATMSRCACEMRDRWRDGETLDVAVEMNRLTMIIVAKTLFGAEVDAEAGDIGAALSRILELFERSTLPADEAVEFDEARAVLNGTILRIIEQQRASGEDRGDLLSMLLLARDDEDASGMSDEQIRDEALTIFLAGHETTANALTWTWYLLSQNRDAETEMHGELVHVLGARTPEMHDIPRLELTRRVFSEALRLYPPVWAMGRRALCDVSLGDFQVPKDSVVIASPYLTQRDARWFPEPLKFDPERWEQDATSVRPRFSYFPFSAGSRGCLGENFAWMESLLILATLAARWRLELVPGHRVELQPQLTLRAKYGMRMTPRTRHI
ncbi:MAG: hypothetical protein QOD99_2249 [Chthoniobacter sp.]|nr:hypothetical protein [Chthoniobacter sp.]